MGMGGVDWGRRIDGGELRRRGEGLLEGRCVRFVDWKIMVDY
jgi:hypothetical protein